MCRILAAAFLLLFVSIVASYSLSYDKLRLSFRLNELSVVVMSCAMSSLYITGYFCAVMDMLGDQESDLGSHRSHPPT